MIRPVKYLMIVLFLQVSPAAAFTTINAAFQADTTQIQVPETNPEPATPFYNHSIFLGTGFGNDLLYTGTTLTDNSPFLSADILYSYKGKLWTSATIYNLPDWGVKFPLLDASLGYNHVFNDYFDIAGSVSYYHSSGSVKEELYDSFSWFRLSGGFDWYWIYSKVTYGRILAEDSGSYLYFRNSRYFRTASWGKSKTYISVDPNINLLFGNSTQISATLRPGTGNPDRPGQGGLGRNPVNTDSSNQFNILQTEISVPVSLYIQNFTIDAEPLLLFPHNSNEDNPDMKGFYIFLNISYRIF